MVVCCFVLWDGQISMATRQDKGGEGKHSLFTNRCQRDKLLSGGYLREGVPREQVQWSSGDTKERVKTCEQVTILRGQGNYTMKMFQGISLVHLNVTRSQEIWAGYSLIIPDHLGADSSYFGDVETERKSLTIKTKLRIVRLIESEMIQNKGSILSKCIWSEISWKVEYDWVVTVFARDVSQLLQNVS